MFRITITGTVQGVGFRPYIFRQAEKHKLKGTVRNTGTGVEIISSVRDFPLDNLPPLARIERVAAKDIGGEQPADFQIITSHGVGAADIPADQSICRDCERELNDPKDRRHNYYFTTCTNCGPRFSMIDSTPYDRPNTKMADFVMCEECRTEYTDPADRRYHAQTIACKKCGPKLTLKVKEKDRTGKDDTETTDAAAKMLRSGLIIGIKGIGGFHLACTLDKADELRNLLERPHKPFAIMVRDTDTAKTMVHMNKDEEAQLTSMRRPIMILRKKDNRPTAVSELHTLGIMLPYTALHYMLMQHFDALIMTSCNRPGLPTATVEDIAQIFLTHERDVHRCDDSVIKNHLIRRSRGYAPVPIILKKEFRPTIAMGGDQSNTICVFKGKKAYLSQHIGNLDNIETMRYQEETVERMIELIDLKPEIIACDLHPNFNSVRLAETLARRFNSKLVRVQHHEAHLTHPELKNYIGIAMDGTGYGRDGRIWGGEVLHVKDGRYERIAHLEEMPMIGGEAATMEPARMLYGILRNFLEPMEISRYMKFDDTWERMLSDGFNIAWTTSTGRVLDAASALLKLCKTRTYDGRPAMLLESIATMPYELEPKIEDGIISVTLLFKYLLANVDKPKERLAATVQTYLARAFYMAADKKLPIIFSGGVAYNEMISDYLLKKGCIINKEVPPGDGGLAFGQGIYANLASMN